MYIICNIAYYNRNYIKLLGNFKQSRLTAARQQEKLEICR
jgi:hypothetical protein